MLHHLTLEWMVSHSLARGQGSISLLPGLDWGHPSRNSLKEGLQTFLQKSKSVLPHPRSSTSWKNSWLDVQSPDMALSQPQVWGYGAQWGWADWERTCQTLEESSTQIMVLGSMAQSLGCPYGNDVWLRAAPPRAWGSRHDSVPPSSLYCPWRLLSESPAFAGNLPKGWQESNFPQVWSMDKWRFLRRF